MTMSVHIQTERAAPRPTRLSARAHARWKQQQLPPAMFSDWDRTLMIHYEVEPAELRPQIPFGLDTFEGKAYVSLVAFTLRRLRPRFLPRRFAPLTRAVSEHGLLNVRTYVRHHDTPGIYFLAEWLPNRISMILGPPLYGLPYRYGRLTYQHDHDSGRFHGRVDPADESRPLIYERTGPPLTGFRTVEHGSLDEFLMERYHAFTQRGQRRRRFDVWHAPWPQRRVHVDLIDDRLVHATGPWRDHARHILNHYSPGVRDVWMSRPRRLD